MPQSLPEYRASSPADLAACRNMLCGGSRSFYAASFLLPRSLRGPATALYAFCRMADDLIDLDGGRTDALGHLADRLDRIYAGRPYQDPVDRALTDVVLPFGVPRLLLDALLEGFAWDAQGRRYEDLRGVYDYSARVAGTVGGMMAVLMGARTEVLAARACDLGVAMQLTNIARDVGEDARNGRLYLPCQWLREEGIDPDAWLRDPVFGEEIAAVVRRLLRTADTLYKRADAGIGGLPLPCRFGINAARVLYSEIGQEVARQGFDSISRRAVVAPARKAVLMPRVLGVSALPAAPVYDGALKETRFLVQAITAASLPETASIRSRPGIRIPTPQVGERVVWVLDLFERLERRDRMRRAAAMGGAEHAAAALRG